MTSYKTKTSPLTAPLRILLLNSARKWIGEAAHTLALAQNLARDGHHVVIAVRRGFELESRAREAGLSVEALHMGSRFHPLHDLADCLHIRRIVRERHIGILHANRGKDHWLAAVARLLMSHAPALVRTRHVVTPASAHVFNRWLYARGTDALVSVSAAAEQSLGALAQLVPAACRRVIFSSVDTETFCPEHRSGPLRDRFGIAPGDILIGMIARFQRVKGHRYLLQATARLAAEGLPVRLLLAGRSSPSQRQRMADAAQRIGLPAERLHLEGWVDDLPALIASFDIGVVASVGSEGSSRVGLEYMASGLPIVATRVGGIPELIDHGRTGLLVAPRDADALAEALADLIGHPARREEMARTARNEAIGRFNRDRWLQEMCKLYAGVNKD